MIEKMTVDLPEDVLHIICQSFYYTRDISTLFNVAVSCRRLAALALATLYRMHDQSPFRDEEQDVHSAALQEQQLQKWTIMWRSLIMSSLDETMFPYCRYLKALELRDFQNMIEEERFRGKTSKLFFSGSMRQFNFERTIKGVSGRSYTRFDVEKIVVAVGHSLVAKAPLLESLSATSINAAALQSWIQDLPRLRCLELGDGQAIATTDVQEAILNGCPRLEELMIFQWIDPEADAKLASFISSVPENSLKRFRTITNRCGISTQTCIALNQHSQSLRQLHLCFHLEAVSSIGLIKGCTMVEDVALEIDQFADLEGAHQDSFEDLVEWLRQCKRLKRLSLDGFKAAPKILTPLLLSNDVRLQELEVQGPHRALYSMKDSRYFHQALDNQSGLVSLCLRGDPDEVVYDDNEALIESVRKLTQLRELKFPGHPGVTDYFDDEKIMKLLAPLRHLSSLYIGGYGITDAVLDTIAGLTRLQYISFQAVTSFTQSGLLRFIDQLGPGNESISLSVDNANPDSLIEESDLREIREALWAKVRGRFDYIPLRDPDVSDFDQSDSE